MTTESERIQILEMVDKEQITVEQAVELLAAIRDDSEPELLPMAAVPGAVHAGTNGNLRTAEAGAAAWQQPVGGPTLEGSGPRIEEDPVVEDLEPDPAHRPSFDPAKARWRSWWWLPMSVGITVTVFGALFMYLAWQASGLGIWFVAACLPFLLGVTIMGLSWASRKARWLHIRIQQPPGKSPQRIAISLPLPLKPLVWLVRVLRPNIPNLQRTGLDELILALETNATGQPIYIEVNEGDSGEHVEVYFG